MTIRAILFDIVLVATALCVALLNVLPAYVWVHAAVLGIVCLASFVAGWFCLSALFRQACAAKGLSRSRLARRWVLWFATVLAHACWIPVALALCFHAALPHDGFMGGDDFVGTKTSGGETFHVYHVTCPVPDNACECDSYRSLVYRENRYLPVLHWVAAPAFFVDLEALELHDGVLTLTAEPCRPDDAGKMVRIRQ